MKTTKLLVLMAIMLICMTAVVGCSTKGTNNVIDTTNEIADSGENNKFRQMTISNLSSEESLDYVSKLLKSIFPSENVDEFINIVSDYNNTVENTSLISNFEKVEQPIKYDVANMSLLWASKKGESIGTNCRINTFILMKNSIKPEIEEYDDSLLFADKEAIEIDKLLNESDLTNFAKIFSRIKTESTTDVNVHVEKMKAHLSKINFNTEGKMVSVVIHDNLDGDYLFIGHVGVLVKDAEGYIFIEKISFEEPYQAIKFANESECYEYLLNKYERYKDESTSYPFIMVNDKLALSRNDN